MVACRQCLPWSSPELLLLQRYSNGQGVLQIYLIYLTLSLIYINIPVNQRSLLIEYAEKESRGLQPTDKWVADWRIKLRALRLTALQVLTNPLTNGNTRQYHERRSTFIGISKTKIGLHSNRRETVTLIQDDENLREMALDWLQYANDDRWSLCDWKFWKKNWTSQAKQNIIRS